MSEDKNQKGKKKLSENDLKKATGGGWGNFGGFGEINPPKIPKFKVPDIQLPDFGDQDLDGGRKDDDLEGGRGNDHIDGKQGDDDLSGGAGNDVLEGGQGDDILDGGTGHDTLNGGKGDDQAFGGSGNDSFQYEFGEGQDHFDGGSGKDTLVLNEITNADDWQIKMEDGSINSLSDVINKNGNFNTDGVDGVIISPDGSELSFSNVEKIEVNEIDIEAGNEIPLQVSVPNEKDVTATVITGLPAGVSVTGQANPPVQAEDGTFFQVVDRDSLNSGDINFHISEGFIGDINYGVSTFTGSADDLQENSTSYTLEVPPTNDSMLFAQSGSFGTEVDGDGHLEQGDIPVDIILNPTISEGASISISGLADGAKLTNSAGATFEVNAGGEIALSAEDLIGLRVDPGSANSDFELEVTVESSYNGESIRAEQSIHIDVAELSESDNGDSIMKMDGKREDYQVDRIGNALVVSSISNPDQVTRVNMTDIDHLRFEDGFVSSEDYTQSLDVSSVLTALDNNEQAAEAGSDRTLVVVSNVPDGAVLDGSIDLGNGAFGIPASEIANGALNLDLPSIEAEASAEISVSAYVMTEDQAEFLGGQGRVSGYASAEATAEAGVSAEFEMGPDGVRAEVGAYAGASAVATAGGSVGIEGVGSVSASVEAEAHVSVEASAGVEASKTGVSVSGYVGAEATSSVTGTVGAEADFIPGTGAEASGTVAVTTYANAGAEGEMNFGDGEYGVGGEAGAEAGMMVTAEGTVSGSVGGVGGSATGGVEAGLGVGASAGGHAGYDNGVIEFGVSGELACLIGVEFDFDVSIDCNDVAETAEIVADGVITAGEAIGDGLMEAGEAIEGGLIEVGDAIEGGFIEAGDAIEAGIIDAGQAIESGLMEVGDAIEGGFIEAGDAIEEGFIKTGQAIKGGFIDAGEAIEGGFIDAGKAVEKGFIDAGQAVEAGFIDAGDAIKKGYMEVEDAIEDGFIEAGDAIEEGFIKAKDAVGQGLMEAGDAIKDGFMSANYAVKHGFMEVGDAIEDGFMDAGHAINKGFISATNAVEKGFMSVTDAVEDGFMSAGKAIEKGFMSAEKALDKGFITVEQAVNDFGASAERLVDKGYSGAKKFCEDAGDAIVEVVTGGK